MSWIARLQQLTNDHARMVQGFSLCRTAGMILASIIIARALPLEEVGTFEMLMFCGYVLTFFWTDGFIKGFLARHGTTNDRVKASTFVLVCLLLGMIILALFALAERWLIPLLTHRENLEGLHWFIVYQAMIIPVWLLPYTGLLREQQYLQASAFVLFGPAISCLGGLSTIPDLRGILIGLVSYATVALGWALVNTSLRMPMRIWGLLKDIWPATWPLMLYAISTGLARSVDAWLVARYFEEGIFAVFRYGARDFPLVVAFAGGLSTVMIPKLISAQGLAELKMRSARLMHICYPIIAVLLLANPYLFALIFGKAYADSAMIFNTYLLVTLAQLVFPQSVLMARGDSRWVWYVSLAELAVNIAASLLLMSWLGLIGIVWGTVIAFAFEKLILFIAVFRRYGITPGDILPVRQWLTYAFILVLMYIIAQWMA